MRANEIKIGQGVRFEGAIYVVTVAEHRTPGNLRAFVQLKMRDVISGKYLERRFTSTEDIEVVELDRRQMEYLYSDSSGAVFMDTESYDQTTVPEEVLGDALKFLRPNTAAIMLHYNGNPITVELPPMVVLKVADTPPGIKGATATNQTKPATLETGLETKVPPFIEIGEEIKISTADGSYQSRA